LPEHWLNDAVKGYISAKHETTEGNLPQFPNLHLVMPTPEYLLGMKCLASRIEATEQDTGDVNDIVFLIRHLKLKTSHEVMNIVSAYYRQTEYQQRPNIWWSHFLRRSGYETKELSGSGGAGPGRRLL